MNLITKSGNLSSYLRASTQVVASNAKCVVPASPAAELSVAKSMDIVKSNINQTLAVQTSIVGGKRSS